MLTNKKSFVRILALVMALLMTAAIFAGCKDNTAELDELKNQLSEQEKANQDLKDQVAAGQKEQEETLKNLEQLLEDLKNQAAEGNQEVQDQIKDVESQIAGFHPANTTAPAETKAPLTQDDHHNTTQDVLTDEKLAALSELITLYTKDRADWYTAENFAKLAKIFEEASYEIYRATTVEGVDQVIAEASAAAAAIDSIVSDAAKVQALIDAFGNVETEIFTTNDDKVEAARAAFDNWVKKYEVRFFLANGCTAIKYNAKNELVVAGNEKALVDFARKLTNNLVYININDNTNSLLYAEAKLAALYAYAEDAIKNEMIAQLIISGDKTPSEAAAIVDVLFDENATQVNLNDALDDYEAVTTLVEKYGVTYAECKANGKLIEDAYTAYRVFWNNNGGDDTPISGAPAKTLLTGEQFVKLYVLTLYNGELSEYQNTVKDYLYNKVIEFFMNKDNVSEIKTNNPTWADLLSYKAQYHKDYNADGTQSVVSATETVTFAVQDSYIQVYVNGTAVAAADGGQIPADGVQILKDFNRVAAKAATAIFALDYDKDFKGNKDLDNAYIAIDQIIVQSIVEMTQVYYNDVVYPVVLDKLTARDEALAKKYVSNKTDDFFYSYDNAFYKNVSKLIVDAKKYLEAYTVDSYEDLNKIYSYNADTKVEINNIEDQKMFNVTKDAQGVFQSISLFTGDANGNNSAMKTVLEYFEKSLRIENALGFYTKMENLADAEWFYDLKCEYAEAINEIVGVGATFDKDDKLTSAAATIGLLGADYYTKIQDYMGKTSNKYNLKQATIYAAVNAPRKATVDAIMALEFMNYDTAEVLYTIETYQAKNVGDKAEALYYDKDGKITKTADKNTKLDVVVDREVVAQNAIINAFATGADAVVKAFADLARAKVQANVSDGKALYEKNYSFGDKDPVGVFLENDMDAYIEYLNSLTGLAGITAFKAVDFSLVDDRVAISGTVADLATKGYTYQEVKNAKNEITARLPHVTTVKTSDEVTGTGATVAGGYYNDLTTKQLNAFFGLTAGGACDGLEAVRELAYEKDDAVNVKMPALKAAYLGTWNATKGEWTVAPKAGFEYDLNTLRTQVYLDQFNAAYDRIVAAIEAINFVEYAEDAGYDKIDAALAAAKADVTAILTQADNDKLGTDGPNEADDLSLAFAYIRYYKVAQYDWELYNKNIND